MKINVIIYKLEKYIIYSKRFFYLLYFSFWNSFFTLDFFFFKKKSNIFILVISNWKDSFSFIAGLWVYFIRAISIHLKHQRSIFLNIFFGCWRIIEVVIVSIDFCLHGAGYKWFFGFKLYDSFGIYIGKEISETFILRGIFFIFNISKLLFNIFFFIS
jgi:hypothetical protein